MVLTNVFTITSYSGLHPEVSAFGSSATATGYDNLTMPSSRSYQFGIRFGILNHRRTNNMMKKILFTISTLASLTLFKRELDYAPQNTMVDETVYKEEKTAQSALIGAYTRLCVLLWGAPNDQNNYTNSSFAFQLADIGTENITVNDGASSLLAMEKCEYTTDEHDGFIKDIYQYGYNAIDYANNIIAGINEFGQYDPKMMKQHIAEAKFLRAYEYFTLLCIYGDGALVGEENGLVVGSAPYSV